MIELQVEPRIVKSWEQFLKENPAYSIALDGYVRGGPKEDLDGPYVNFNHHEDVHPLATRSTCAQVYVAIKDDLFDAFKKNCQPHAHVYVNDPDQDTCVAVWLLQNHELFKGINDINCITNLVTTEDMLDTFAGAYPINPQALILKELAWIFEPYTFVRTKGTLSQLDGKDMKQIITSVGERITQYVGGRGQQLLLQTEYQVLGGGPDWMMIKELGAHARTALFATGVKAFVSVRERPDGNYQYVIGKRSTYSDFPISTICKALNMAERLQGNVANCWSGGNKVIGSPRETGSRLKPIELTNLLNESLQMYEAGKLKLDSKR